MSAAGDGFAVGTPGVSAESFWLPKHYVTSAWYEHAPFAAWVIAATRPRLLVELGTHNGFSFFAFGDAVVKLGLDTSMVAVDSWEGDDQAGFYGADVKDSVQAMVEEDYPFASLRQGYFDAIAPTFVDGSIDLLHIDGRHGYDDVKEDYESYESKLSDRAVVLFHDTREYQETFRVHRFWDELAEKHPSFTFEHGHGLGVLAHGSQVPQPVLEFLARATADPAGMRSFYARLGAEVSRQRVLQVDHFDIIHELRLRVMADEAALAAQRERSTRIVHRFVSSTSWRVTAPLRTIGSAMHHKSRQDAKDHGGEPHGATGTD